MADNDLSVSSISAQKQENVAEKFEVTALKKAIDQQGDVSGQLIASATQRTLPDGVGQKVNVAA